MSSTKTVGKARNKDRIETYGFTEGEDFKLDSPNLVNRENQGLTGFFNGTNAKTRKDYHLTLDFAKELATLGCFIHKNC